MARLPLPADTILGRESDQYRIDTVLGPGGFGITYLARSLRLERDVAIKEYFPIDFAYRDGSTTVRSTVQPNTGRDLFVEGKKYFIEEARVLGKFRHDHIVRVINLIEEFNTAYMVLEFEEGQSLKHWLEELRRPPTQAEMDQIFDPMLSALDAIHGKGIFHRDIAPDNIIVRPNGQPVLIDFGAARVFARENSHTLGAIVKHGYSPPEQYTLDTKLQGSWSDIYSLSATMYFALLGRPPEEASSRQIHDRTLPIEQALSEERRAGYDPSLLAGINAGLALLPRNRPASTAEFRAILHAGRDSQTSQLTGRGSRPRSSSHAAKPSNDNTRARPDTVGDESVDHPWRQLSHAAGLAGLVIAVVSAIGFVAIGGNAHPQGLVPLIVVCLGLNLATTERCLSLFRRADAGRDHDFNSDAGNAGAIIAVALAILWWLPLGLSSLTFVVPLLLLAAVLWLTPHRPWKAAILAGLAALHLVIVFVLIKGTVGQQNPYMWPLILSSFGIVSILSLLSAILIWRNAAAAVRPS